MVRAYNTGYRLLVLYSNWLEATEKSLRYWPVMYETKQARMPQGPIIIRFVELHQVRDRLKRVLWRRVNK